MIQSSLFWTLKSWNSGNILIDLGVRYCKVLLYFIAIKTVNQEGTGVKNQKSANVVCERPLRQIKNLANWRTNFFTKLSNLALNLKIIIYPFEKRLPLCKTSSKDSNWKRVRPLCRFSSKCFAFLSWVKSSTKYLTIHPFSLCPTEWVHKDMFEWKQNLKSFDIRPQHSCLSKLGQWEIMALSDKKNLDCKQLHFHHWIVRT